MFTGIIEGTGRASVQRVAEGETRIRVEGECLDQLTRGESISVNGVCLTVVDHGPRWFEAVVAPETLSRTTLGERTAGNGVNLERSLRLGDRISGHIVQGHVDGIGFVEAVQREGTGSRVRIGLPAALEDCVVRKGSIAVDGVSLTVAARAERWFEVALVPETLSVTHLSEYRPGTRVNLEVDVLGRYVIEYLKHREADSPPLVTRGHLAGHGFGSPDEEER